MFSGPGCYTAQERSFCALMLTEDALATVYLCRRQAAGSPRCSERVVMKKGILLLVLMVSAMSSVVSSSTASGQDATRPHVVFLIGEDEYKTEISLPAFARTDLEPAGLRVTIIHA